MHIYIERERSIYLLICTYTLYVHICIFVQDLHIKIPHIYSADVHSADMSIVHRRIYMC